MLASTFPWFVRIGGTLEQHDVNGQPGAAYLMSDEGLVAVDIASGAKRRVA